MARIAGIKYERNAAGEATKITIDLKKWGAYLEDFLDLIEVEQRKKGGTVSWEKVKAKLDSQHFRMGVEI